MEVKSDPTKSPLKWLVSENKERGFLTKLTSHTFNVFAYFNKYMAYIFIGVASLLAFYTVTSGDYKNLYSRQTLSYYKIFTITTIFMLAVPYYLIRKEDPRLYRFANSNLLTILYHILKLDVVEFIEQVNKNFKYIVFGILLLLSTYLIGNDKLNMTRFIASNTIDTDSTYLNKEKVIEVDAESIFRKQNEQLGKNETSRVYTIAFDLFVSPTTNNSIGPKRVFEISNKFLIMFNESTKVMNIQLAGQDPKSYNLEINGDFKYQKWNKVIFVVEGNNINEFYINGNYVNKTDVSAQPPFTLEDLNNKLFIGKDEGIFGGIKNILYFDGIISFWKRQFINTF